MTAARWQAWVGFGAVAVGLVAWLVIGRGARGSDPRRQWSYDRPRPGLLGGVDDRAEIALERAPSVEASAPAALAIEVRADDVRVDGEAVADAQLVEVLRAHLRRRPALAALVTAPPDVAYARVVQVLDDARTAGITSIGFASPADP